jgi:glutamate-ammonia-ligase adenylyltransferase
MYWRGRVDWHFRQVIADPDEEDGEESELVVGGEWLPLWEEAQDEDAACRQLAEGGFTDAPSAQSPGRPARQPAIARDAAPRP